MSDQPTLTEIRNLLNTVSDQQKEILEEQKNMSGKLDGVTKTQNTLLELAGAEPAPAPEEQEDDDKEDDQE